MSIKILESRLVLASDDEDRETTTADHVTFRAQGTGPNGVAFRLASGLLCTVTVADVATGVEDTTKAKIQTQALAGGTAVLSGDMRALGVDDGLQAWAEGS